MFLCFEEQEITMSEITMPRLSDTMQEGTIARWLKKPGDEIKKGDVLAEIETDKATMDLEAYEAVTLQQILAQAGETVPIDQVVALIGAGAVAQNVVASPAPVQRAAVVTGADKAEVAPAKARASTGSDGLTVSEGDERRAIKASPLARRIAGEHSIDLDLVQGTGPGGRIVRDDIDDFLEQRGAATAPAPAAVPAAPPQAVSPPAAPPCGGGGVQAPAGQELPGTRPAPAKRNNPHPFFARRGG